jgi:transcriptional regulator with XRE-family HTH domain
MTSTDTITLSRQDYQDLVDARDHAVAMREAASGAMETIPEAEMDNYLTAPSPLAFWRKRRGMTQKTLADAVGITQPYVAQIEHGNRHADVELYVAFAKALGWDREYRAEMTARSARAPAGLFGLPGHERRDESGQIGFADDGNGLVDRTPTGLALTTFWPGLFLTADPQRVNPHLAGHHPCRRLQPLIVAVFFDRPPINATANPGFLVGLLGGGIARFESLDRPAFRNDPALRLATGDQKNFEAGGLCPAIGQRRVLQPCRRRRRLLR